MPYLFSFPGYQTKCVKFLFRSLLNHVLGVLACFVCLCVGVLTCLACLRVYVLACLARLCAYVFACLRARELVVLTCLGACMRMLCLRASYNVCLACLPLTYSRFCLIIYFVCINQGFAIKRKLLIYVNLS